MLDICPALVLGGLKGCARKVIKSTNEKDRRESSTRHPVPVVPRVLKELLFL
jgi:hypothetical protein